MDNEKDGGSPKRAGGAEAPTAAANDNWQLMPEWMTPAELLQWIRRSREEMRQERSADASLLACPNHRRIWASLEALESCTRWRYFRRR